MQSDFIRQAETFLRVENLFPEKRVKPRIYKP
jgi:hypothetical protein